MTSDALTAPRPSTTTELGSKVAVVTGAGKGIGLAIARTLAARGAHVVGASRRPGSALHELPGPGRVLTVAADLTDPDAAERLVTTAVEEFGGLDIVVNNVGSVGDAPHGSFLDVTDAQWRDAFERNVLTAVRVSRAALPHMTAGGGAIVNIGSINASLPNPSIVDYAATKAALASLTKTLSMEFAPQGVRVNGVSPGPVRTPLWTEDGALADRIAAAMGTDRESAMAGMVAGLGGLSLDRFAEPSEIAELVAFLVSPRASYITGSDIVIDGGLLKTL